MNTNNVTDINGLFYNCSSLKSLPDISKWNTNNVINMDGLFYNCSSLNYLPDISKFKTDNLIDIRAIFGECSSLLEIPDISKWFINLKKISIEEIVKIFQTLNEKTNDSNWIINYKETIQIDIRKIIGKIGLISEKNDLFNWLKKFQEEFNRKKIIFYIKSLIIHFEIDRLKF